MSDPTVIAEVRTSKLPRQRTKPTHSATITATIGDKSDFTLLAFRAALISARLASARCRSSSSCRPNAFTTRIVSSPCCTTPTMSLCRRRTSRVAFLISFLNLATKSKRIGATATATSAKSQLSQNIKQSIPITARTSIKMLSVEDDAKSWIVSMSSIRVLRSAEVWWVS